MTPGVTGKLRVIFMGTPAFSLPALNALAARHEIAAVYTQPDRPVGRGLELRPSPVKARALELGLTVHQPEKLSQPGEYERLQALKCDVMVVVAYGQILRRNVLDLPRLGCVNIHSSLLPRWRGAAPIQWAILSGDAESGVTTMRMAEKLDAGDVLMQVRTPITAEDTASTLHDRLAELSHDLILESLEGLASGTLKGQVQDEALVTYASKLSKEMEWLDPEKGAAELDRQIRALTPWPGTSVKVGGLRLKIKRAVLAADGAAVAGVGSGKPGESGQIAERGGRLFLRTSRGALELLSVQWDGKKEVDARGFINGVLGSGKHFPIQLG